MAKPTTLSFVVPPNLKALIEAWAREEDRTMSATLRRIIEAEAQRRKKPGQSSKKEAGYRID